MAEPTVATAGEFKVEQCDSCQAPIIWCSTGNKMQPVDAEPVPGGYLAVQRAALRTDLPLVHRVPVHLAFGRRDLRTAHHQTCPHGKEWKRKGRAT